MLGPFPVQPIDPFIFSPVGMVPKWDSQEMHHITHLSHHRGCCINTSINPEDAQMHYQTFKATVELVAWAGPGAHMAKEDFKSVFHNVPMCFNNLKLLSNKVQGQFFYWYMLTFWGINPVCHFWRYINSYPLDPLVHYVDNFFTVHPVPHVCSRIMSSFKKVCHEIGMPISLEKVVGPVQIIQFLGLTIDTVSMVIKVPEDKRADILETLQKMIQKRKATSLQLQSSRCYVFLRRN